MFGFSLPLILSTAGLAAGGPGGVRHLPAGRLAKFTDVMIMPEGPLPPSPGTLYAAPCPVADSLTPDPPGSVSIPPVLSGYLPSGSGLAICPETMSFPDFFNTISGALARLRGMAGAVLEAAGSGDIQGAIELTGDFVGLPAYVADSCFKIVAIDRRQGMRDVAWSWRRAEDDGYLPYSMVDGIISSREIHEMESAQDPLITSSKFNYNPFVHCNLRAGGVLLGHLRAVSIKKPITEDDAELLAVFSGIVARAMSALGIGRRRNARRHEFFLSSVLSGRITEENWYSSGPLVRNMMGELGFERQDMRVIAVSDPGRGDELAAERALLCFERFAGCRAAMYGALVAAVIPIARDESADKIAERVDAEARRLGFAAGVSDAFRGYAPMADCRAQAEAAMASRRGEPGATAWQSVAMASARAEMPREALKMAAPAQLAILREHDRDHGLDLTRTLKVYIENERSLAAVSDELHIHRNTAAYRIAKITELCGFDLNDRELRKRLLLTLD